MKHPFLFPLTLVLSSPFAPSFYVLGTGVEIAFRISILWLAFSVPFGCIVGAYLCGRDNLNPPIYRIVYYYGEIE